MGEDEHREKRLCKSKTFPRHMAVGSRRGLNSGKCREAGGGSQVLKQAECSPAMLSCTKMWIFSVEDASASLVMLLKRVGFGKCFKKQEKPVNRSVVCCQPLPCAAGTGHPD